nr:response regulator [Desulfobulbaceae bacterium]
MRILIVEDEKMSQKKMQLIMENFGECDMVADGASAIDLFNKAWQARAPYDIITLDITLHEMSGVDVLVQIKDIEDTMNILPAKRAKIIMVTSHKDKDNITTCVTAGCSGYIIKPFTKEPIAACLRKVFLNYVQENFPKTY